MNAFLNHCNAVLSIFTAAANGYDSASSDNQRTGRMRFINKMIKVKTEYSGEKDV